MQNSSGHLRPLQVMRGAPWRGISVVPVYYKIMLEQYHVCGTFVERLWNVCSFTVLTLCAQCKMNGHYCIFITKIKTAWCNVKSSFVKNESSWTFCPVDDASPRVWSILYEFILVKVWSGGQVPSFLMWSMCRVRWALGHLGKPKLLRVDVVITHHLFSGPGLGNVS